jgi:hypothetical protein
MHLFQFRDPVRKGVLDSSLVYAVPGDASKPCPGAFTA